MSYQRPILSNASTQTIGGGPPPLTASPTRLSSSESTSSGIDDDSNAMTDILAALPPIHLPDCVNTLAVPPGEGIPNAVLLPEFGSTRRDVRKTLFRLFSGYFACFCCGWGDGGKRHIIRFQPMLSGNPSNLDRYAM